jgi:hypothetical protein
MGTRFLTTLLIALLVTAVALGGAGYTVTQIAVPTPRDVFRAAAFEFDLAPGWWCELDETEYVCNPPGKPPLAAIAIMAMKERNEKDTLNDYEEHLRQPQSAATGDNNRGRVSEIRYVRRRMIANHEWVEALHAGSEVPNYDTYYLATITSDLGVLVTMSVHKDHSNKYIGQLNDMIATLNIYQR